MPREPAERGGKSAKVAEQRTRLQQLEADGTPPAMPPIPPAGAHIITHLFEAGPVMAGPAGALALTWGEIEAWQRATATPLTPWEARTLRRISAAYAGELHAATEPDAPAPYTPREIVRSQRQAVARGVRNIFGARARKTPAPTE